MVSASCALTTTCNKIISFPILNRAIKLIKPKPNKPHLNGVKMQMITTVKLPSLRVLERLQNPRSKQLCLDFLCALSLCLNLYRTFSLRSAVFLLSVVGVMGPPIPIPTPMPNSTQLQNQNT